MRATVLCYNLKGTAKGRKIGMIFGFLGYKVRHVDRSEYMLPLEAVAEGQKEDMEASGKMCQNAGSEQETESIFQEEMLVMCPENEQMLDQALFRMRKEKVQVPLKAVLTETNKGWTSIALYEEIKKEHERMTGKS